MTQFLIYGVTGYTGTLIAQEAVKRGLRPILAARNLDKLMPVARELGLDYCAFGLDNPDAIDQAFSKVSVVLNCAGPFSRTFQPLAQGCLRTRTHYLDITGEIAVFEAAATEDAGAKVAKIMIMPGVGFDVVPSDCLALHLKQRLPDATHLTLAIAGMSQISRGTATTMVEGQKTGGMIRRAGTLCQVPLAWKMRKIDFGQGEVDTALLPWGDVATAYYSTGIPNIEVYASFPKVMRLPLLASRYLGWILGLPALERLQKQFIQKQPPGPNETERQEGFSLVWGEVKNSAGQHRVSRLQCPEGYQLTALTALAIVEKVLANEVKVGFQTPAMVYGADFILAIEGVMRQDID